jgi:predicted chitinase
MGITGRKNVNAREVALCMDKVQTKVQIQSMQCSFESAKNELKTTNFLASSIQVPMKINPDRWQICFCSAEIF